MQSEHFGSNSKPSSKSVSKESLEWLSKWFKNYFSVMTKPFKWLPGVPMLKRDSHLIARFKIFLKNDPSRQCFSPKTPTVLLLCLTLSPKSKKIDLKLSLNHKMLSLDLRSKTKIHIPFQKQRHSLLSESNVSSMSTWTDLQTFRRKMGQESSKKWSLWTELKTADQMKPSRQTLWIL